MMKVLGLAILANMATHFASADPLDLVDYERIAEQHTGVSQTLETGWTRIEPYEGLVLNFDASGRFQDGSDENGMIGCLTALLGEVLAVIRVCPEYSDPETQSELEANRDLALRAYASGILPDPLPLDQVRSRFEDFVSGRAITNVGECEAHSGIELYISGLGSERIRLELEALIEAPRLPIVSECF